MTALDLYDSLVKFSGNEETTICCLHKPCSVDRLCSSSSSMRIIDFDSIERKLATGKRSFLPSCDGVTLNNNSSVLCFVEIKGWAQFVKFNVQITETISDESKHLIDNKAKSFKLREKLMHSMEDCEIISGESNLFLTMPYVYIIVSDIQYDCYAINDFAANLSFLAESASVWAYCDVIMNNVMNNNVGENVFKVYTHCKDFDDTLSKISSKSLH